MGMFKKYKNIILVLVLAVLVFVGYRMIFGSPSTSSQTLQSQGAVSAEVAVAQQELLSTLLTLRDIKLQASIFEDPVFRSLEDFSQTLNPKPIGRRNPFAPIGTEGNAASFFGNDGGSE